jgi:hypothetical protein
MAKTKLTLNIDDGLIEPMKLQAVRDKRSLSDITEELYQDFLTGRKATKQSDAVQASRPRRKQRAKGDTTHGS